MKVALLITAALIGTAACTASTDEPAAHVEPAAQAREADAHAVSTTRRTGREFETAASPTPDPAVVAWGRWTVEYQTVADWVTQDHFILDGIVDDDNDRIINAQTAAVLLRELQADVEDRRSQVDGWDSSVDWQVPHHMALTMLDEFAFALDRFATSLEQGPDEEVMWYEGREAIGRRDEILDTYGNLFPKRL